ncbi:MAG TPA: GAF domain-containing SpoIIE family protein phosphatase, partial [Myxococcota bacterium]|nr:GAF domain-containing SpoIIE family protein phosphatase [Myxococcota bacterium]
TAEGEAIGAKSVVAYGLRSVMAAPLLLRDNLIGVIYLDNRLAKGVFTEADVDILVSIGNHIAIAFETARAATVEAAKIAYEKDLALTAAVQTMFLPRSTTMTHEGVTVAGLYLSAAQCSGDWWWAGPRAGGETRVLLGDVTGHGAAPAMLTAAFAGAFKVLNRRAPDAPFDVLLTEMSKDLEELTVDYAMASLGLEIAPKARQLRIWSAGSPPVVILRGDGSVHLVTCPGTPLGRAPLELGHKIVDLNPRDRVFAFTDGLTELELAGGRQLGIRTLNGIFAATRNMSAPEAAKHIEREVETLRGDVPQGDDITLVVIDVP